MRPAPQLVHQRTVLLKIPEEGRKLMRTRSLIIFLASVVVIFAARTNLYAEMPGLASTEKPLTDLEIRDLVKRFDSLDFADQMRLSRNVQSLDQLKKSEFAWWLLREGLNRELSPIVFEGIPLRSLTEDEFISLMLSGPKREDLRSAQAFLRSLNIAGRAKVAAKLRAAGSSRGTMVADELDRPLSAWCDALGCAVMSPG
jgi:hypothetical protein